MFEEQDELLLEEIQCCQNDEDIQNLVDSQCLDIIGNESQSKLALKQLFRVIKIFRYFLINQDKPIVLPQCSDLKNQIKIYEGDKELLRQLPLERLKNTELKLQNTLISISEIKNNMISDKLCVICQQQPYGIMILPCGHICVCEECSKRIDKCPIDRKRINQQIKCFLV